MAELISQQRHGSSKRHLVLKHSAKQKAYPVAFKREICRLRALFPTLKLDDFIQCIKEETGYDVPKTTVHRMLKEQDTWFNAKSLGRCRLREGRHKELEADLMVWATGFLRRHGTLTYALIKEQAEVFARQRNFPEDMFKTSNGWCTNFCRRHDLKMRRRCGEGGDANRASADLARDGIPAVLQILGARPEDTFNCDETGIIFGAQPHRTLAPTKVSGTKKVLDRLTVLFCCNVTGTERMRLVMLGTMQRARDWGAVTSETAWHPAKYVTWIKAPKAWMNRDIFNGWLCGIRGDFMAQGRKLFLIMDNCAAHSIEHPRAIRRRINNINVSHET